MGWLPPKKFNMKAKRKLSDDNYDKVCYAVGSSSGKGMVGNAPFANGNVVLPLTEMALDCRLLK